MIFCIDGSDVIQQTRSFAPWKLSWSRAHPCDEVWTHMCFSYDRAGVGQQSLSHPPSMRDPSYVKLVCDLSNYWLLLWKFEQRLKGVCSDFNTCVRGSAVMLHGVFTFLQMTVERRHSLLRRLMLSPPPFSLLKSVARAECSLNPAKCSLNPAECSLNHAECSLNHAESSLR
jgi:hypothetical protein